MFSIFLHMAVGLRCMISSLAWYFHFVFHGSFTCILLSFVLFFSIYFLLEQFNYCFEAVLDLDQQESSQARIYGRSIIVIVKNVSFIIFYSLSPRMMSSFPFWFVPKTSVIQLSKHQLFYFQFTLYHKIKTKKNECPLFFLSSSSYLIDESVHSSTVKAFMGKKKYFQECELSLHIIFFFFPLMFVFCQIQHLLQDRGIILLPSLLFNLMK